MIKFLFFLTLAFLVASLILSQPGAALAKLSTQAPAAGLSQEYMDLLPAGYTIPKALPTTIQDPLLLTGWVYLYNQQESLQTWNGAALTGRMLAHYVLDQQVTIVWNTINDCDGGSCSERPHAGETRNTHPILIRTALKTQGRAKINELAGTLAHEIYHHMLPFGNVPNTLYEEFWGYSTGTQISKSAWTESNAYNPMKGACLKQWFQDKSLAYYLVLKSYPQAVSAAADTSNASCTVIRTRPGEVEGFPGG